MTCPNCAVHATEARALREALWDRGSKRIRFDDTVVFGNGYDFWGWENLRQELYLSTGSYAIWRDGGKWSAYCERDGGMMLDRFQSEQEAKDWVWTDALAAAPPSPVDAGKIDGQEK